VNLTPVAVVGVGQFGQNHCRVIHDSTTARLAAVVDINPARVSEVAAQYATRGLTDLGELKQHAQAAIVAVPTSAHEQVGVKLLEAGFDVLIEKPVAPDAAAAGRLIAAAERHGRILQIGHLERFNPAVIELERRATLPLFFEIHRLNLFSLRSLDIDVVLDLMIHDVDIVLGLVKSEPTEIRAAGISILSPRVDIASVRMQFPNGCVANFTASRVSTERVRKLRLFQPQQYLSLDYTKQELGVFSVGESRQIGFEQAGVTRAEPLQVQLEAFLESIETRKLPKCSGAAARQSLGVALAILDKIKEHSEIVSHSLVAGWKP
jgi:predicted dehydrogenase